MYGFCHVSNMPYGALSHLFLEVADCVGVSIGEQVQYSVADAIVLEVVHHVSAIALLGEGNTVCMRTTNYR